MRAGLARNVNLTYPISVVESKRIAGLWCDLLEALFEDAKKRGMQPGDCVADFVAKALREHSWKE